MKKTQKSSSSKTKKITSSPNQKSKQVTKVLAKKPSNSTKSISKKPTVKLGSNTKSIFKKQDSKSPTKTSSLKKVLKTFSLSSNKNAKKKGLAIGGAMAAMTGTVAAVIACTPQFEVDFVELITGVTTGTGTGITPGETGTLPTITDSEATTYMNGALATVSRNYDMEAPLYREFKSVYNEIQAVGTNIKLYENMLDGSENDNFIHTHIAVLKRLQTSKVIKLMNNVLETPFQVTNRYYVTFDSQTNLPNTAKNGNEFMFNLAIEEPTTGASSSLVGIKLKIAHPIESNGNYQISAAESAAALAVNKNSSVFASNYQFTYNEYQMLRLTAVENQLVDIFELHSSHYLLAVLQHYLGDKNLAYQPGTGMYLSNAFLLPETLPESGSQVDFHFTFYSTEFKHITYTKVVYITVI